jgi:hypothetical protein
VRSVQVFGLLWVGLFIVWKLNDLRDNLYTNNNNQ